MELPLARAINADLEIGAPTSRDHEEVGVPPVVKRAVLVMRGATADRPCDVLWQPMLIPGQL